MRLVVGLALAQITVGCASVGGDAALIMRSLQQAVFPPAIEISAANLDPKYRYLWLQVAAQAPVILVLGFEETTPHGSQETWYSADGGFVQTVNGRLSANPASPTSGTRSVGPVNPALQVHPPCSGTETSCLLMVLV